MHVCTVCPAGWRNCGQVVAEIDENVDDMPVCDVKLVWVYTPFQKTIVPVSTLHVVTDQHLWPMPGL